MKCIFIEGWKCEDSTFDGHLTQEKVCSSPATQQYKVIMSQKAKSKHELVQLQ